MSPLAGTSGADLLFGREATTSHMAKGLTVIAVVLIIPTLVTVVRLLCSFSLARHSPWSAGRYWQTWLLLHIRRKTNYGRLPPSPTFISIMSFIERLTSLFGLSKSASAVPPGAALAATVTVVNCHHNRV